MSEFGWLPQLMGPQTTAQAVPYAINEALKAQGMAPFPATAMSMPTSVYRAVIELAGATVRQMGISFTVNQLHAELKNRGYTVAGSSFGNGPRLTVQPTFPDTTGLATREAAMAAARARTARDRIIATLREKALPIGIVGAVIIVGYLAYRKKGGR